MESTQVLSRVVQTMIIQQTQTQGVGNEGPHAEPTPPTTLEVIEDIETIPTIAYHKAFISIKPSSYMGKEGPDNAE